MEDIRRVFFHELGHFVANEIIKQQLEGMGTETISIYPCEKNPEFFCGDTLPVLPLGMNRKTPPPKNRLAQSMLCCVYGCLFQAYERGTDLKFCFDKNGDNDVRCWSGYLNAHQIDYDCPTFAKYDEEYFDIIKSQKALDNFLTLTPQGFLVEKLSNSFIVDIELLTITCEKMIEEHTHLFMEHLQKYQTRIDELKPFDPKTGKYLS